MQTHLQQVEPAPAVIWSVYEAERKLSEQKQLESQHAAEIRKVDRAIAKQQKVQSLEEDVHNLLGDSGWVPLVCA